MRKFLIALFAVATLGAGTAFAQSGYWAGLSTGFPFGVSLHFGMEDLLSPGIDVRFNVKGSTFGGAVQTATSTVLPAQTSPTATYSGFVFSVGADVLYNLDLATDPNLNAYVGGGLDLGFASGSTTPGDTGIGGFVYDVHALGGAEYLITPEWGVFGEGQIGFGSKAVAVNRNGTVAGETQSGLTFAIRIGGNYHF